MYAPTCPFILPHMVCEFLYEKCPHFYQNKYSYVLKFVKELFSIKNIFNVPCIGTSNVQNIFKVPIHNMTVSIFYYYDLGFNIFFKQHSDVTRFVIC